MEELYRVFQEHKMLKQISSAEGTCNFPYLPTLYSTFQMGTSFAMVMTNDVEMILMN